MPNVLLKTAFALANLTVAIMVATAYKAEAKVMFPVALLTDDIVGDAADLSIFEGSTQFPGVYDVNIVVNGESLMTQKINFTSSNASNNGEMAETGLNQAIDIDTDKNVKQTIEKITIKDTSIDTEDLSLNESDTTSSTLESDASIEKTPTPLDNDSKALLEDNKTKETLCYPLKDEQPEMLQALSEYEKSNYVCYSAKNQNSEFGQDIMDSESLAENVKKTAERQKKLEDNTESMLAQSSSRDIVKKKDDTGLVPSLTAQFLVDIGVDTKLIPGFDLLDKSEKIDLEKLIPNSYTYFDFQKMRLEVNIPQVNLLPVYKDWASPEKWDNGINAAFLNYNASASNTSGDYTDSTSAFLSINAGVNIGPWRIRDYSNAMLSKFGDQGYQSKVSHLRTYAERGIVPLKSSLTLGDYSTSNLVFDSIPIRGVQLSSNENMYPTVLRGFAPVITGFAKSSAVVTVRQNNHIIYKTNVAAGNFSISDLYSVSSNGDLEVTVEEFEGETQQFTIPFSNLPSFLRPGRVKFSSAIGQLNAGRHYEKPIFAQGGFVWGLPYNTLYGGSEVSKDYLSFRLGSGFNLGSIGGLSTDVTYAKSHLLDGSDHDGYSLGLLFARRFPGLGTNIQIAGYRYSSEGFYKLQDTALKPEDNTVNPDDPENTEDPEDLTNLDDLYYNLNTLRRERFHINISQKIKNAGSLNVSGVRETYWNSDEVKESIRAGYGSQFKGFNYNFNYEYSRSRLSPKANTAILLTVSKSLGKEKKTNSSYMVRNTESGTSQSLSFSHQPNIENVQFGGGISTSTSGNTSYALNAGHQSSVITSRASLNYSDDALMSTLNLSGGMILHKDGLTFGQSLGGSSVLIDASGVEDLKISNVQGVKTNRKGFAIQPYVSEYRANEISVNVDSLDLNAELEDSVVKVIPTKGAIVKADFNVKRGLRALFTLYNNGKELPFGSVISHEHGQEIVGDGGEVYLSGLAEKGQLKAVWGQGKDSQCTFDYDFTSIEQTVSFIQETLECNQ